MIYLTDAEKMIRKIIIKEKNKAKSKHKKTYNDDTIPRKEKLRIKINAKKIMQELMDDKGSHYMPLDKLLKDDTHNYKTPQHQSSKIQHQRKQTANFEISDTDHEIRPSNPLKQERDLQAHRLLNTNPNRNPTTLQNTAYDGTYNYYPQNLAKRVNLNQSLGMPPSNIQKLVQPEHSHVHNNSKDMSDPKNRQQDPYQLNQHNKNLNLSDPSHQFDPMCNSDDLNWLSQLILDVKMNKNSQNRHQSQTNTLEYNDFSTAKHKKLPYLSNIKHDPLPNSETRKHINPNSNINGQPTTHSGMMSTKLPKINKMQKKNNTKFPQSTKKANSKAVRLPHYMKLRNQDMENKVLAKKQIKKIKNSKPRIITYSKKKPTQTLKQKQESSMSKLRRFRRNLDNSEVDRSESHYRR